MGSFVDQDNQKFLKLDYSRIFSPSKLAMYGQCPKEYEFNYVDPIQSKMKNRLKNMPENIWPFYTLGKAVHNAITMFYYLPKGERTLKKLKENLMFTWRSEVMWNKKPPLGKWGGFMTLEEEREYYRQGLSMLETFFSMAPAGSEFEFLPTQNFRRSIEDYEKLITYLTDDFDISGKFDLVTRNPDGSLNIIDFKTGKKDQPEDLQMTFYRVLAELRFKKPVKNLMLYLLRFGKIIELNNEGTSERDLKGEIIQKIVAVKSATTFSTNVSKLCKFCLFKDFCPERAKVNEMIQGVEILDYSDDLPF